MDGSIGIQAVPTRFGSSQNGSHDRRDEETVAAADTAAPAVPEGPAQAPPPPGLGQIVDVTI